MSAFRSYYELVKPGIIYGNAVTAAAGFIVAARGATHLSPLLLTLLGLSFVIAGSCIINNYIDRDIDARMLRTKARLFARGEGHPALLVGVALCMALSGLALLATLSALAALAALAGFAIYVALYTPAKRVTPYATHIGAIAGATPPLVGYFAAGGAPDLLALTLFLMLFLWQLPHFFAIAVYRGEEYQAADVPVLTVARGVSRAQVEIVLYTAAFALVALAPFVLGTAGLAYGCIALALGLSWLALNMRGFYASDKKRWARQSFFSSLGVLLGTFGALALTALF